MMTLPTNTEIRCRLGALPEGLVRALRALADENVAVVRYELEPTGTMEVSRLVTTDPERATEVLEEQGFETEVCPDVCEPASRLDRWAFRFAQGADELERSIS